MDEYAEGVFFCNGIKGKCLQKEQLTLTGPIVTLMWNIYTSLWDYTVLTWLVMVNTDRLQTNNIG